MDFLFLTFHKICLMSEFLFAAYSTELSRASLNDATLAANAG